ncbi:MAG: nucleoside kinase [Clostridiales bacterium]|jgi:uridine kinase|nr:nucleoside kinase [Clostridiales bacterium]
MINCVAVKVMPGQSPILPDNGRVSDLGDGRLGLADGVTLMELSGCYQHLFSNPIILAKVDNECQELYRKASDGTVIEFDDISCPHAFRAYQRSVVFLMILAAKEIISKTARVVVEHSINKNYYCEIPDEGIEITQELLDKIEERMREIVSADLPIEKFSIPLEEGIKLAREFALFDKVDFLKYRRTTNINFYRLSWFYDYFYGPMVPSSGYLTKFKLHKTNGGKGTGFTLQFPVHSNLSEFSRATDTPPLACSPGSLEELSELKALKKMSKVFEESNQWAKILKVDTVGALNNVIAGGGWGDIVRVSEALHEKKIAEIADMIHRQGRHIVLIAGPSSSGKTTFAMRLCIQLRVNGLRPRIISLDNYYLSREHIPLDEYGERDFESIDAIDVRQINEDLTALLAGAEVPMPGFNFASGKREYNGSVMKLARDEVLIIEGIHGLNEKLTSGIPKKDKFKIFISALTQLNIDDHNRIPTTDTRLIRRIVRDNRTRGMDTASTIAMWPSVLRGEARYIFPFQEEADVFFNSALVYEMCVLKQYVEASLFHIQRAVPEYTEAKRLIKFLDSFLGMSSEQIMPNSILREFIGGSCFHNERAAGA